MTVWVNKYVCNILLLHKVTGAGPVLSLVSAVGQRGGLGVQRLCVEGRGSRGGSTGREPGFLTAWWMKLSLSLLDEARRLCSPVPDGSRPKKLCDESLVATRTVFRVRRTV